MFIVVTHTHNKHAWWACTHQFERSDVWVVCVFVCEWCVWVYDGGTSSVTCVSHTVFHSIHPASKAHGHTAHTKRQWCWCRRRRKEGDQLFITWCSHQMSCHFIFPLVVDNSAWHSFNWLTEAMRNTFERSGSRQRNYMNWFGWYECRWCALAHSLEYREDLTFAFQTLQSVVRIHIRFSVVFVVVVVHYYPYEHHLIVHCGWMQWCCSNWVIPSVMCSIAFTLEDIVELLSVLEIVMKVVKWYISSVGVSDDHTRTCLYKL